MTVTFWLRPIVLSALCIATFGPSVASAQVHKVIGPDGKITYSDTPPDSNQGAKASKVLGLVAGSSASGVAPKLRRGLWEFRRTLVVNGGSKELTTQNCTDPVTTMTFWQKTMAKAGCTYEDTRRAGQRYTQNSACKIDAVAMDRRYTKTLDVNGDDAYVLEESASGGSQPPMSSVTRARRLGDC